MEDTNKAMLAIVLDLDVRRHMSAIAQAFSAARRRLNLFPENIVITNCTFDATPTHFIRIFGNTFLQQRPDGSWPNVPQP